MDSQSTMVFVSDGTISLVSVKSYRKNLSPWRKFTTGALLDRSHSSGLEVQASASTKVEGVKKTWPLNSVVYTSWIDRNGVVLIRKGFIAPEALHQVFCFRREISQESVITHSALPERKEEGMSTNLHRLSPLSFSAAAVM